MKKPFLSLLLKKTTSRNERNANAERVRTRALQLESLENRELLSVAPGSEFLAADNANIHGFISNRFTVDEARAAYELGAASRANDVVDIPEYVYDGAEAQTVATDEIDSPTITVDAQTTPDCEYEIAEAGVSGPGRPSEYFDADKSAFNKEDDYLCWAATASNMLWYTDWARVTNAQNEQEFFDTYFVNSWADDGGSAQTGISWFLNDLSYSGRVTSAYVGAGYYSQLMGQYGESPSDYLSVYSATETGALQNLAAGLTAGDAAGLSIFQYSKPNKAGHAITCWGYTVDTSYSSTDPRYFTGLYITDSDDEKSGKNDDELNERILIYVGLEWSENLFSSGGGYFLNDYSDKTGNDRYYLSDFQTLKTRPEKYAVSNIEARSTIVTTADDVYDVFDGKISLREALAGAHPGETITFANSLKGKTISLNSERGELIVNKTGTIDASNLWNATTSEPGITISGQKATRILTLDWGAGDVEINGIKFTDGYSEHSGSYPNGYGGAIFNYGSTLTLDNCLFCDNEAYAGGAICSNSGYTTLENCIVANNTAYYGGGLELNDDAALYNCTITGNSAKYGGGVDLDSDSCLNAYNTLIVSNSATYEGADVNIYSSNAVVNAYNTLSSFSSWTNGANNLTFNASKPLFANAESENYKLANNSQAINKGDELYVNTSVDFAGNKRISGEKPDLGAYEYQYANDLEPLSTPADVAYSTSIEAINVSWQAVQGATGYRIAYRTNDGLYTTVDVASNKTSYSLTGLTGGLTYDLRVAALGNGTTRRTSYYSKQTSVYFPAVITVTSAGDVVDANDGVVTLREALSLASVGDTIAFANTLKGKTIALNSTLKV